MSISPTKLVAWAHSWLPGCCTALIQQLPGAQMVKSLPITWLQVRGATSAEAQGGPGPSLPFSPAPVLV